MPTATATTTPFRCNLAASQLPGMDLLRAMVRTHPGRYFASWKIDGVRATNIKGELISRSGKPIRNVHVQKQFKGMAYHGMDGELVVGKPYGSDTMKRAMAVTSISDFVRATWCVFDDASAETQSYVFRRTMLADKVLAADNSQVWPIPQIVLKDPEQIALLVVEAAAQGYEGLIIRDSLAKYKNGRSTLKEATLLKVKAWETSTAVITGYELLERNDNDAKRDERGYQVRSSEKAGKRPVDLVGNLLCRDSSPNQHWSFSVGSGFDDETRRQLFEGRHSLAGEYITYKYMVHGSTKGVAPRHPVFLFRGKKVT
jgi:ATP-dependent DNA ligase